MKLKKAKLVVSTVEDIKQDSAESLNGHISVTIKSNEIVLSSYDTLAKIFAKNRMEILRVVASQKVKSIYELAKLVNRDFKNVYSDVKLLSEVGLIELKETEDTRRGLQPIAKFSGIDFNWKA